MSIGTKQFINLDSDALNRMSKEELLEVGTKAMDAARKRLSNLKKAGFKSTPATLGFETAGGTYKRSELKKMTRNQVLAKMYSLQDFLKAKTSTPTGAKEWKSNIQKSMTEEQKKRWDDLSDRERSDIWALVDWVRKNHSGMYSMLGSDRVISLVEESFEDRKSSVASADAEEYRRASQTDVLNRVQTAYDERMDEILQAIDIPDDEIPFNF